MLTSILWGENTRQTQIERHSRKLLISPLQKCQGHEREGKTEDCHRLRGPRRHNNLMIFVILDWILDHKKDFNGKFGEIRMKSAV